MHTTWLQHLAIWMQEIQAAGWAGWVSYLLLYAFACLLFIPGSVMAFGAGAIYGFWGGLALALMGNGLSALLSLLITRYLLRDWSARFFARHPTMDDLGAAVQQDGWRIVCLTHLSPIMPFSLINYAFGLTKISASEFLLATILGGIPAGSIYVYLGTLACNFAVVGTDANQHRPLIWFLRILGLTATIVLTVYIARRANQALKRKLPHQGEDHWIRRRKKRRVSEPTPSGPS
jgi:uncharacterized membrane protein YdjX (TVP38/TMEM64 family)